MSKCKVIVTGENAAEFNALAKKYGQVAALEAIVDTAGNPSIDGFLSDVEISDRVNALAFSVFNHLRSNAGALSALDLTDDHTQARHIAAALEGAKGDLERLIADAIEEWNDGIDVSDNAHKVTRGFVALQNFENLVPKIKERLASFGLTVHEKNNDLEGILESEVREETDKERIYSRAAVETSRLDSIPVQVKMYIATLGDVNFDENNNTVQALDDIGMPKPVNFHDVYAMLSKRLANHATMEDMMDTLKVMAEETPVMKDIYEDLANGLVEPDTTPVVFNGAQVKNFENAFYTAFKNTANVFTTVATRKVENRETGEKGVGIEVLNTNRRRLDNLIRNEWVQKNREQLDRPLSSKQKVWEKMSDILNPTTKKGKLFYASLNKPFNKTSLKTMSDLLSQMGIYVDVKALDKIRKAKRKKGKEAFGKWVMTDSVSLKGLMEKFWNDGKDSMADESSTIRTLSQAQAEVSNDNTGGAFMNGKGNLIYPINLPTAATELFDDFNQMRERAQDFIEDPLMSVFHIVRNFTKADHGMEMTSFDTIYDSERRDGIDYSSLDPASAMATRLGLFMNFNRKSKKGSKKFGWLMIPTPSDRSGSRLFKMPKMQDTEWTGAGLIEGDFKDWLIRTTNAEFERIKQVRQEFANEPNKDKLIENYHYSGNKLGNGAYFNSYPALNEYLLDENGDLNELNFESPELFRVLEAEVRKQVRADIDYMVEIGMVTHVGYKSIAPTDHAKKLMTKGVFKDATIYSFVANSIVANHELSTIFNGDLAHFKAVDYEGGDSQTKLLADANKRAGLADAPGAKLRIGKNGANPTFRVAFVEDVQFDSDYAQQYIEAIGEKSGKMYNRVDVTDAQGFVSLDRYAEIMNGLGQLTPELARTIAELKKPANEVDWSLVTVPLQPVKGFLQSQRYDDNFGRIMPKNLKYSLLPVIPAAISNNPMMESIKVRMDNDKIGELVFKTGSKMGAYNINNLFESERFDYVELSNEDWRMPQVVPYKTKTAENMGTQLRKLIMGNLNFEGNYGDKTGKQLQEDYQQALALNLQQSFQDLLKKLSEDGSVSVAKVADMVLNDLAKNAYKSTPDFIEQALQVVELANGEIDTRIPMSFPAIKHRVESSINSAVRKAVTKQTTPGFSAVQYSAIGFGKESVRTSADLKFVRQDPTTGQTLPAEVYMSPQYFIQSLLKMKKTPAIEATIEKLRSGDFDINDMPEEVRTMVIYRIPTQGKNSALPIIVKGFTPEALGSTITIPAELTVQSGADYDIDKVYVEARHFEYGDNGFSLVQPSLDSTKGRDNMIVDTHYRVLTNPEHFSELITPNNSDTLNALSGEMAAIYAADVEGRVWSSMATQDDFRDKNQAGGIFIGIASIANTAHSLFQELNVKLKTKHGDSGVYVNGREVTSLSQKYVGDSKRLISDDHIEVQTAAVDNAKNPVLGNLNVNTITGSTFLFLVEAGAGLTYAAKLINTPIIRELTKLVRRNEAIMGKDGAFATALDELVKAKNIPMDDANTQDHDVKLVEIEESIKAYGEGKENDMYDASILKAFLTFKSYGDTLSEVQRALQTDNVGAHQTLAANIIHRERLARVKGTFSNANHNSIYPNDVLEPIETIELDREAYEKHSMESFEKYGLDRAILLVSEVIEDSTPVFQAVLKEFQHGIGGNLVESDLRMLMNDFYAYIMLNKYSHTDGKTNFVSDVMDSTEMAEMLVGEFSVGKQVAEFQDLERRRANEDVNYRPNAFVNSLTVTLADPETGYDLVSFNNTISRALTSEQKTTLSNEFKRLMTDPLTMEMGRDLFLYSLGMEGFSRGSNSFSDYVHTEMYEAFEKDGENMVDFFRDLREDFYDIQNFNTDEFMVRFLRNRGTQLKGLKDFSMMNNAQIKTALESNPRIKYFLVGKVDKVLAMRDPGIKNRPVKIGKMLGVPNVQVEYLSGTPMANIQDVQDAFAMAQAAGDVETNNACSV